MLFIVSILALKGVILLLRVERQVASFMDVDKKPFQAVGWVMILAFTPFFWFFSFFG
jgi:hypothetical protein